MRQWARIAQQNNPQSVAVFAKNMAMEKAFADAGGLLLAGIDLTGYGQVTSASGVKA